MATVEVVNLNNDKVGEAQLHSDLFERAVRKDILHEVVKWQRAKRRAGTHKAKTRSEVSGGGAKPYKQKGTGNARRGSSRSPLIAGGGAIFAPAPRDYSYALPKKIRKAAIKYALSYLHKEGRVKVVQAFESEEGKTKVLARQFQGMGLTKSIFVGDQLSEKFSRASRNISGILYTSVDGINVYDLLKYNSLLIEESALGSLEKRLLGGKEVQENESNN